MFETEVALLAGFAIVSMFCWLGKQRGRPSDPIS